MKHLSVEEIRQVLSKIPGNLVVAEHTDTGHFYRYTPTNQLFASVTTKSNILDAPHLKKWSARLAVDHLTERIKLTPGVLSDVTVLDRYKAEAVLIHQDQFEEAGDIGTRGHGIVDEYLLQWMKTGTRPADIKDFVKEDDSRLFAISRSAEMFCKDFFVIPIASEMFVASKKHRFAGTLDSLMMVLNIKDKGNGSCADSKNLFDGGPLEHQFWQASTSNPNKVRCVNCGLSGEYEFALVDWKTSNSIDKETYAMQVSAYWQAIFEMTGLKPKKIFIVRLDKAQAKYEIRYVNNRPAAFKAFTHVARVYDWLHDDEEKLIPLNKKERVKLSSIDLTVV